MRFSLSAERLSPTQLVGQAKKYRRASKFSRSTHGGHSAAPQGLTRLSRRPTICVVMFRAWLVLVVGLAIAAPRQLTAGQQPDLSDILHRAGSYVEEFQRQLSGIVAQETYVQEIVPFRGMNAGSRGRIQSRRLRSDLLLLRPEGAPTWVQFRDVFEVDGQPVRDREERLARLFLSRDVSNAKQVEEIRSESARYNIGRTARTMNVPLLPLSVLAPGSQRRFKFTVEDKPGDNRRPTIGISADPPTPNFKVTAEGWILKFQEVEGPTLIYTTNGANIFSRGRFWIEPETGRVLMSEMITENAAVRGEVAVSYQSEPLLGLLVPVELRERYIEGPTMPQITGQATYSNFRRFQVSVDQSITPIQ
jgi:hypothetical protein